MEGPYKVLVVTMWFINLKGAVNSFQRPVASFGPQNIGCLSCESFRDG